MMKTKRVVSICFLILLMASFVACGTFVRNSYRTLSISSVTYEISMKSANDLFQKGLITEEEKVQIIKLGTKYWNAYHMSVDSLESYMRVETVESEKKVEQAMLEFSKALATFMDYINPILGR